jgi:hypothetical protein
VFLFVTGTFAAGVAGGLCPQHFRYAASVSFGFVMHPALQGKGATVRFGGLVAVDDASL